MRIDLSFWRGRRVLLTGHTGFKGAWLATWLTELGAEVTGLALPPRHAPSLWERLDLGGRLRHVEGDVRDRRLVAAVMSRARPRSSSTSQAQPLVLDRLKRPLDTFDTNVTGTLNLLQAARAAPHLRAVVVITSDKSYRDPAALRRGRSLGGDRALQRQQGLRRHRRRSLPPCYLSPRRASASPPRGPATSSAAAISAADRLRAGSGARASRPGGPVPLRHPDAIRPWQHVLDAVRAISAGPGAAATAPGSFAAAWNFGPVQATWPCARWPTRLLARAWRRMGGGRRPCGPHEAPVLRLIRPPPTQLGWCAAARPRAPPSTGRRRATGPARRARPAGCSTRSSASARSGRVRDAVAAAARGRPALDAHAQPENTPSSSSAAAWAHVSARPAAPAQAYDRGRRPAAADSHHADLCALRLSPVRPLHRPPW